MRLHETCGIDLTSTNLASALAATEPSFAPGLCNHNVPSSTKLLRERCIRHVIVHLHGAQNLWWDLGRRRTEEGGRPRKELRAPRGEEQSRIVRHPDGVQRTVVGLEARFDRQNTARTCCQSIRRQVGGPEGPPTLLPALQNRSTVEWHLHLRQSTNELLHRRLQMPCTCPKARRRRMSHMTECPAAEVLHLKQAVWRRRVHTW